MGSGMRNTYKYTRRYSGAEPQFVEGDVFRTIIPLTEAATATVGPAMIIQDTPQDISQSRMERLVKLIEFRSFSFCSIPKASFLGQSPAYLEKICIRERAFSSNSMEKIKKLRKL